MFVVTVVVLWVTRGFAVVEGAIAVIRRWSKLLRCVSVWTVVVSSSLISVWFLSGLGLL